MADFVKNLKIYRGPELLDEMDDVNFKLDNLRGYASALGGNAIFSDIQGRRATLSKLYQICIDGRWRGVTPSQFDAHISSLAVLVGAESAW